MSEMIEIAANEILVDEYEVKRWVAFLDGAVVAFPAATRDQLLLGLKVRRIPSDDCEIVQRVCRYTTHVLPDETGS